MVQRKKKKISSKKKDCLGGFGILTKTTKDSLMSRVPKVVDNKISQTSKRFGLSKIDAFQIFTDDSEIIDVKNKKVGRKQYIDVIFKKRFIKKR